MKRLKWLVALCAATGVASAAMGGWVLLFGDGWEKSLAVVFVALAVAWFGVARAWAGVDAAFGPSDE